MRPLRPHQERAVALLRSALAEGKRRPLLQMPTGAGKTLTAAWIIDSALRKGRKVAFVVPALALIDQTVEALWAEGVRDVGVMQGAHRLTRRSAPVQVCSAQTLARRERPEADVVIVDEAHVQHSAVLEWMRAEPKTTFVGLSATPWARGLANAFDALISPVSMAELIEAGHLTPFRVFAPSHPDLSGVRTVAGDYHDHDLAEAMGPLVGDVVDTWLQRGEGRPTLCFAVDRAHARHLAERFEAAGVACGYVDGDTDAASRETLRRRFAWGELKVICNVGVLTTGVDWDVRCIILARPTKSEMLYVQMIGRGLRPAEGKADCLVLDHSDTTLRLGFVTDISHPELDDGSRKTSEDREREAEERASRTPSACPNCTALRPKGVRSCPSCGFTPQQKSEGLETRDGDLVELDARRARKANRELTWHEKAEWLGQVRMHARVTGKKEGWAAWAYKKRFGVWPNDMRVKNARPREIGPEVAGWIKAQAIRFAKGRERAS